MQLISTIINELTDVNISLTSPLLKTKVIASRIRHEELKEWASNELTGYKSIKIVPKYRITKGEIYADYLNGNFRVSNQQITLPEFDEELSDRLYSIHFTQTAQNLESFAQGSYLEESFDSGQRQVLTNYLESQNPQARILNICRRIPANFVVDILSNIRARLLDFMLQLEERYGFVSEIKELGLHNQDITHIMNNTIYNVGDGNNIVVGNNNNLSAPRNN